MIFNCLFHYFQVANLRYSGYQIAFFLWGEYQKLTVEFCSSLNFPMFDAFCYFGIEPDSSCKNWCEIVSFCIEARILHMTMPSMSVSYTLLTLLWSCLCTFVKALKHQQLTWIWLKLDSQVNKLCHTEGVGGGLPLTPLGGFLGNGHCEEEYCKRWYFRVINFSRFAAQKHIRGLLNSRWADAHLSFLYCTINIIQWMIYLQVCM